MTDATALRLLRRLGAFSLLWLAGCAVAQPVARVVTPEQAGVTLTDAAYVLEDPQWTHTFEEVRGQALARGFVPREPVLEFSAAAMWVRGSLTNPEPQPLVGWFDTGNRTAQEIDLYAPDASGRYVRQSANSRLPFDQRPLGMTNFVFPIELPPRQTVDVYLRVRSTSYLTARAEPAVWVPEARLKAAQRERSEWFLYVGVALALAVLNFALGLYLRDRIHMLYVVTTVGMTWTGWPACGGPGCCWWKTTTSASRCPASCVRTPGSWSRSPTTVRSPSTR